MHTEAGNPPQETSVPLSLGEIPWLRGCPENERQLWDKSQIKGIAFPLKLIILGGFKLVTEKMKERAMGRIEKPENKTQTLQCNSCGGQAPIPTACDVPARRSRAGQV